jgi:hypothetical protein
MPRQRPTDTASRSAATGYFRVTPFGVKVTPADVVVLADLSALNAELQRQNASYKQLG